MVLIISNSYDQGTSDVIRWLNILGANWIRINENDTVRIISLDVLNENFQLSVNDDIISSSEISSVWFRRGEILSKIKLYNDKDIKRFISSERKVIEEYLWFLLLKKRYIGNRFQSIVNKLTVLNLAKNIGLQVPDTYVVNDKSQLKYYINSDFITKALSNPILLDNENYWIPMYTKKLVDNQLNKIPNIFSDSLVQKSINKKFELRIIFFNDKFYSIAMFYDIYSPKDIDIRKKMSNHRFTCYKIPNDLKNKLSLLMNRLKLNFGTIDILVDNNYNYIFLEVNPVGQFSYVASNCNFSLNEDIAKYLFYGKHYR